MVEVTITQSSDDAQDQGVNFDTDDTFYYIAEVPNPFPGKTQGWRFQSVNVPQAATITSAELELATWSTAQGGTCRSHCLGVDEDDTETWSDPDNLPGDANLTDARDTMIINVSDTPDGTYTLRSFDVTAIVQEIVDRGGWVAENNMSFITGDDGSSDGFRYRGKVQAHTYDHTSSPAPKLKISYEGEPEPTGWASVTMYQG